MPGDSELLEIAEGLEKVAAMLEQSASYEKTAQQSQPDYGSLGNADYSATDPLTQFILNS